MQFRIYLMHASGFTQYADTCALTQQAKTGGSASKLPPGMLSQVLSRLRGSVVEGQPKILLN